MKHLVSLLLLSVLGICAAYAQSDTTFAYKVNKNGHIEKVLRITYEKVEPSNYTLPFPSCTSKDAMNAIEDSSVIYADADYKINFYRLHMVIITHGFKWIRNTWKEVDVTSTKQSILLYALPLLLCMLLFILSLFYVEIHWPRLIFVSLLIIISDATIWYAFEVWYPSLSIIALAIIALVFMVLKIRYYSEAIQKEGSVWKDNPYIISGAGILIAAHTVYFWILIAHVPVDDLTDSTYLNFSVMFWGIITIGMLVRFICDAPVTRYLKRKK